MLRGAITLSMLTACASHVSNGPRSAVVRDVTGYAIASCLTTLDEPLLTAEGGGWAAMIVQRGHGDIESLGRVSDAVDAAVKGRHPYVVRDESSPTGDIMLPVAWCAEMIDEPPVRAAIQRAVDEQQPAYERAKVDGEE